MAFGGALSLLRIVSCRQVNVKPIVPKTSGFCLPCFPLLNVTPCRLASRSDKFQKTLNESFKRNPKNMEDLEKMGLKNMMKKNRMYAQYNYQEWRYPAKERAIDISCTRWILREYKDKGGMASRIRQPREEFQDLRMQRRSHKEIKKRVTGFHRKRFPAQAQKIYVDAHNLLNSENWFLSKKEETEEALHGLVTEFAYLKMVQGLDNKTINWKFVESIEPPRTVQVLIAPMMSEDNLYGQVTVRFHTRQILAIYDRFGRLMMGSPTTPRDILEYVTFERQIVNPYGKWRIHGKNLAQDVEMDQQDEKTVATIRRKPARIEAEQWHKEEDEKSSYKWYPARERELALLNRPFVVVKGRKYWKAKRKFWVLNVLRRPKLRMPRKDLRKVARKSKEVYEMRQRGELPKPQG